MNDDTKSLVNRYLDGVLTEAEEAELNLWVQAAPENAAAFAEMVRFHDRLHALMQATAVIDSNFGKPERKPTPAGSGWARRSWRRMSLVGGLAALAALAFTVLWGSQGAPANAATELNRLIDASASLRDRTYRITSLDPNPAPIEPRQAPIDAATLYISPPDRYVLVRRFPDGRIYTTGFDGEYNWAAPPDGAVRLSRDPLRFRGALPGHQHGIPFADLRSDLVQLRDAYAVSRLDRDGAGRPGLRAEKKSREYRGPNRVDLWYDPASGVIHRMVFEGLPMARGGPRSVAVDLLEQRQLGADFFKHQAHHGPDRRVIEED
jgi:hypothetical protein